MKPRRPISYADPLHLGRHPFQTYLLILCIVGSLPLLAGHVTAQSVEETLPLWAAIGWGWCLLLGSVLALVGSYWRGSFANALTMERLGLIGASAAAFLYGFIILIVGGLSGGTAACIILAFAAAAAKRSYDLGTILVRAVEENSRPVAREGESDIHVAQRVEDGDL